MHFEKSMLKHSKPLSRRVISHLQLQTGTLPPYDSLKALALSAAALFITRVTTHSQRPQPAKQITFQPLYFCITIPLLRLQNLLPTVR